MLMERFGADLPRLVLPHERYHPEPPAADRVAWEALPAATRAALLARGETRLGQALPQLPATLYMDFRRSGDRRRYEGPYGARRSALTDLVVAECVEARGRFVDGILDVAWAICEESSWAIPAHNDHDGQPDPLPNTVRPYVDLFAAETGALLAWTDHLVGDRLATVSARARARLRDEVRRRVVAPFLGRDDFWWMGLGGGSVNNWNPWCTSNCLAAGLVLEDDPERRVAVVAKALRCLDRFLAGQARDGGCDEGPSYWGRAGGSLFDCLELLHGATSGGIDVYGEPLIRDIGRFLPRVHIDGDWFAAFADGPARVSIAADLVHRFGLRTGDPDVAALGAAAHARRGGAPPHADLPRLLPALRHLAELDAAAAEARNPYLGESWLPVIEVLTARERPGSPEGLFLAAKGGHNAESHNHNDVGQFIVYVDGRPAIVDPGVGHYTAQTFSARRYEIWTMQSQYHNLPCVRGVGQAPGATFRARDVACRCAEGVVELAADIAGAFPPEAGIVHWRRAARLVRGAEPRVEIVDDFRLAAPSDDVRLHLVAAAEPHPVPGGRIRIAPAGGGRGLELSYDAEALEAAVEPLDLEDTRLQGVWGPRLWRIVLRARGPVEAGHWRLEAKAV
jgi:hypothetical protein